VNIFNAKIKVIHMLVVALVCAVALFITEVGTVRTFKFEAVQKQAIETGSHEVYSVIGFKKCGNTKLAIDIVNKLRQSNPSKIYTFIWAAPKIEGFRKWLKNKHRTGQVPASHHTAPVVFRRVGGEREFIGGVTKLVEYVDGAFPMLDLSEERTRLDALQKKGSANKDVKSEKPRDQAKVKSEIADLRAVTPVTPVPENPVHTQAPNHPANALPVQVILRPKNIVTTMRIQEGKKVTNHQAIISELRKMGYTLMFKAPLLANWIILQDQATATYVRRRYNRSIVNNIGYGGQSCFGGTKGYQLRCRSEFAAKAGCSFDSLGIQPAQYRLWEPEECTQYFSVACINEPNRLWIEKPSGGQHGVGMRVHKGCETLKESYSECAGAGAGKKVIAMPYLDPALLAGHKFDVRSYLLVASTDPMLVFYHDGFARKANNPYTSDIKNVKAHITNANSQSAKDHFYTFSQLEETLARESNFPTDYMRRVFREHAFKVQNYVFQASRGEIAKRKGVYQIFALDWIIDSSGGIHMLEANSNPLVETYKEMEEEFTELWGGMVDLVLRIHTNPSSLFTGEYTTMTTSPKRFRHRDWHLIFNELEENINGTKYNPCSNKVQQPKLTGISVKQLDQENVETLLKKVPEEAAQSMDETNQAQNDESVAQGEDPQIRKEGSDELPYKVSIEEIQDALTRANVNGCKHMDVLKTFSECVRIDRELEGFSNDVTTRCVVSPGSYLYIIEPLSAANETGPACYPHILISSGVHGKEVAGVIAARHIRDNWTFNAARVFIVERLNPVGVEKRVRYLPKASKSLRDLNRLFPGSGPLGGVAKPIWEVVLKIEPVLFIDLHEGWGVYKTLKQNLAANDKLVGNPSFSKGSSIISSSLAQPLAKHMINRVNKLTVTDPNKQFLSIVPPIETGLASAIARTFNSLVFVVETSSGQQSHLLRGQQQLIIVGACLELLGIVPKNFDATVGFDKTRACVAGAGGCKLLHPGDKVLEANPITDVVTSKNEETSPPENSSLPAKIVQPEEAVVPLPSAESTESHIAEERSQDI